MDSDPRSEQLDAQILDAASELIGRIVAHGELLAQRLSIPSFYIKALHTLDRAMPMKELGRCMHCDPSFVTVIADGLEKRGLARREAHPGDRRVKNLVLTAAGTELRQRMEREMAALMPWSKFLNRPEREQLLCLFRKMAGAGNDVAPDSELASSPAPPVPPAVSPPVPPASRPASAGEVDDAMSAASAGRD
jgi:MarR family transcriptional regulator, organic hydroperoxide resistance regulator